MKKGVLKLRVVYIKDGNIIFFEEEADIANMGTDGL